MRLPDWPFGRVRLRAERLRSARRRPGERGSGGNGRWLGLGGRGRLTPTRLVLGLIVVAVGFLVPSAYALESVVMPFEAGLPVRIIQGYNGGTHQNRSQLGLDLMLARGSTTGAAVLSPVNGRVVWAYAPGAGNGCITISFTEGSAFSVMMCHVILDRAFARGEVVARGQRLGYVGPGGTVGNNGTPHVHIELHRGQGANNPVPFSPPNGLPLEGVNLPASGSRNEHGGRATIVSTNGASAPGRPAAVAAQPAAKAPPASDERTAPASASTRGTPAKPSRETAGLIRAGGDCLNVREKPSVEAQLVRCVADGTTIAIVDEPTRAEGFRWYRLAGLGWAVADYVRPSTAVVKGTGDCLNVRDLPTVDGRVVKCLPDGTKVTIVGGPTKGDGFNWYQIEGLGWGVAAFIE
ncbi:MAG: peptidoglycan DD-metalloendopeptidase family protein [Chloroflexi bacterium]|nr:peptidoglycan DD-metalloendopeptidase family protein [Chloroflexota bacterium]